ncbi:hypothetical protein AAHB62_29175 [Bacillus cereus]
MKKPKLILLDEATSSLDNTSETGIYSSLNMLSEGSTIIAIAHRIASIKNFDKIFVVDKGKVVECGTFDELIHKQGIFTKIINRKDQYLEV